MAAIFRNWQYEIYVNCYHIPRLTSIILISDQKYGLYLTFTCFLLSIILLMTYLNLFVKVKTGAKLGVYCTQSAICLELTTRQNELHNSGELAVGLRGAMLRWTEKKEGGQL